MASKTTLARLVEEVLGEMDDDYVRCRGLGHAWVDWEGTEVERPVRGSASTWVLSLTCERCGTDRHDLVENRSGDVTARYYVYADHYLLEQGRLMRPTIRQEWKRRWINGS